MMLTPPGLGSVTPASADPTAEPRIVQNFLADPAGIRSNLAH
jgi:hypothetical protein